MESFCGFYIYTYRERVYAGSEMPLSSQNILIVEDEFLIALDLSEIVLEAGASVAGPAISVNEALEILESTPITAAILDINLGNTLSVDVAKKLHKDRIPFVYHTGQTDILESIEWPKAPIVSKPATPTKLIATITGLVQKATDW